MQQLIDLPNIKKLFLPDEGMQIADADFSGADAMVYGWDSECKALIDFFTNPKGKLYAWVASEHLQRDVSPDEPVYKLYKASHHGVWYGLQVNKLARTVGCSESKAIELMDFYDYIYPEKKVWHERLAKEVAEKGYIENIFGRRGWFLNKNDVTLLNKVYSFTGQSTVADLINQGIVSIVRNYPWIQPLLQVHDSAVCQYPIEREEEARKAIIDCLTIPLDYTPTLTIPAEIKWSNISYGDCEKPKKKLN